MLYQFYELQRAFLSSASAAASVAAQMLGNPRNPWGYNGFGPSAASALEVFSHAARSRGKPEFGLDTVEVDGKDYPVVESDVLHKPFGNLKQFRREGLAKDAPKLLIVAPMSGHYATLLRGTVERMIESAEVYITDWTDAKLVPLSEGRFDLDDYIDYVIEFLEHIGPGTHVMAVCQPSVPAFAATAIMAKDGNPARPATLTMMGGPIDTREGVTEVNEMATKRPLAWFRQNLIATVPAQYAGAGRKVYPGFLQLAGFMSMNLGNHIMSHYGMFKHLVAGDGESADATKDFYDEYLSVCDMTAEFYISTVDAVFQEHLLPRGLLTHRGERIDFDAVTDTAILCIEGERDDISGIGQTKAALDMVNNLPEAKRKYHMHPGVGHYGIFNGSKWRGQIAPIVEEWIAANRRKSLKAVA
ncbi:polyhydroxyalkanoate depolymerase [Croceicoccus sp. YJ47]|uniref:polyhydroxyalkanoate depolymerase n=1 Tax=Croceicoccus sp. YJ47 TaxID=2798724 RepID=UPI001920F0BB|nr:polyhydroxyalkanoate depolymerase [Croceicoccus sp. YJ47]QQN73011.1 polyhydroxyalkanoate depolymerase [Croceicoccus sp. YJ47]